MSEATHPALKLRPFIGYKATNAFFQGLWGTAYVGLMSPLPPEVFSAGGIGFSLGTWLVALAYSRLFNLSAFFRISLAVEVIALISVIAILIYPPGFAIAANRERGSRASPFWPNPTFFFFGRSRRRAGFRETRERSRRGWATARRRRRA